MVTYTIWKWVSDWIAPIWEWGALNPRFHTRITIWKQMSLLVPTWKRQFTVSIWGCVNTRFYMVILYGTVGHMVSLSFFCTMLRHTEITHMYVC